MNELKRKTNKTTSPTELCSTLHLQSGALGSSSAASRNVRVSVLEKSPRRHSVVSGPSFLHAGSFGLGDVLVVGLVLQLSAEVLDGFVQAFLQRHLSTHNITTSGASTKQKQKKTHTQTETQTREGERQLAPFSGNISL